MSFVDEFKRSLAVGYIDNTTSFVEKQELTYDEHDNYTKVIRYKNEIPVEMTIRHIEYYK